MQKHKVKRTQYRFRAHKVFLISHVNSSKQENFTKKCLRFQPSLERENNYIVIIQLFYNKFKCGDFIKILAPKWRTIVRVRPSLMMMMYASCAKWPSFSGLKISPFHSRLLLIALFLSFLFLGWLNFPYNFII